MPASIRPLHPSRPERAAAWLVRGVVAVPGLRRLLLWPVVARPGFWFATAAGFLWGTLLLGRHRRSHGLHVIHQLPRWAFGRGGTTIGAVYLTRDGLGDRVLTHEAVHKQQWRRYGLSLPILYLAAGRVALTNRFEVEAGLRDGGYL
ncbi:hypothetical protein [Protaetiibacter larvae]|uniref:Fe-S oxidoreductase n=1 Tax=Protaetiibacter larvae TaxID=2592654 RepID=A0A5C1Y9P9_9MICO|nr:hypothetical protein [Protaetiibacter larvae]QEO10390.1 hypothetical protein FLP23_10465 [Protaetiibacter larvae]